MNFSQYSLFSKSYYKQILKKDCIELFIALQEKIRTVVGEYEFYDDLVENASAQIFEAVPLTDYNLNACFFPVVEDYTRSFARHMHNEKRYERMLRYMLDNASLRESVLYQVDGLVEQGQTVDLISLLRMGFKFSDSARENMRIENPKLFVRLFAEDV